MNTNQAGKTTEANVLSYLINNGYSVSMPFGDKDRYDQVWDINKKLYKVQVKTSRWMDEEHSGIVFSCYTVCNKKKNIFINQMKLIYLPPILIISCMLFLSTNVRMKRN